MVWEYTHVTYHVKLKLDEHLAYGGKCSVTTLQSIQKRSSKREEKNGGKKKKEKKREKNLK